MPTVIASQNDIVDRIILRIQYGIANKVSILGMVRFTYSYMRQFMKINMNYEHGANKRSQS